MAEIAENKKAESKNGERVELYIPRGSSLDEPYVLISVNGVNVKLNKGETHMVEPQIKYEYDRGERAKRIYDETVDKLKGMANQPK